MAYALVAFSGIMNGASLSWTHTFTQNNAVLAQEATDSAVTPAAGDFKDSSGTPKQLTLDKSSGLFTSDSAAHFSLIVPTGFTSPLKGSTGAFTWVAQEWSGNDTTTLLDASNSAGASTSTASPLTGPSLSTGANAGLVIASTTINNGSAANGLTVTGTSFSDTFSAAHDGTQQNDAADDAASFNWRTTSVTSATVNDAWAWTGGNMANRAEVITSYNVAAGAAQITPPLLLVPTIVRLVR